MTIGLGLLNRKHLKTPIVLRMAAIGNLLLWGLCPDSMLWPMQPTIFDETAFENGFICKEEG